MGPPPPLPPPAPLPSIFGALAPIARPPPKAPAVSPNRPAGALLIELVWYNGAPFKNHWAYFIGSSANPNVGVYMHASGDVLNGFELEIRRNYDFAQDPMRPTERIPLQWIDASYVDEGAMCNHGVYKLDTVAVCPLEESAAKIKAPEKSLNSATDLNMPTKRVVQRNCQTWIVESADQLVRDGIFHPETAAYLHAIEQI